MALFKGIKLKMTAATVAAVLATALSLTTITYALVSYSLGISLRSRVTEISKIIAEALSGRQRQLGIRAELIVQDNDFQTSFSFRTDEAERLRKDVEDRITKIGASLAYVDDSTGKEAAAVAHNAKVSGSVLKTSAALKATRESNSSATDVESFGDAVYVVAAAPIKQYDVQTIGYFVMAQKVDEGLLRQLRDAGGAEILLVKDGKVQVATTELQKGQEALARIDPKRVEPVVAVDGLRSAQGLLLSWAMPIKAGNVTQAELVFALSAHEATALKRQVLGVSLGLAILTMGLFGALGLVLARRISDPIVEIEQSFREIAASGNLAQRITKPYDDEVGLMATSFNQMQSQIEVLHNRVVTAEQRMRDELQMASAVQEMLFPTVAIDGARCQIASHSQTSTETGGDWFTVIHAPEYHTTTSIICDVTGHGAPAALVTAIVHGFFKAIQEDLGKLTTENWKAGVESALGRLNKTIIESTHRSLLSSLFLLTFDHRTLKARYVNAGHPAPVLIQPTGGSGSDANKISTLSMGPSQLIGDADASQFVWGELQLKPGEIFILYTDGLIECTNPSGEMYGFKRVRRLLQQVGHQDARTVRDLLLKDAMTFFGDAPRADDITIMVGKVR